MKRKITLSILFSLLLLLFWSIDNYAKILWAIQAQEHFLYNKINKSGVSSLSITDKISIYSANIVMSTVGFSLGYREVAYESLLLTIPSSSPTRTFHSSFPMQARNVKFNIESFKLKLSKNKGAYYEEVRRVKLVGEEARVALALTPLTLKLKGYKGKYIEAEASVPIIYTRHGRNPVLTIEGKPFYIYEGLYWALQEEGWLHPYKAVWTWREEV